MPEKAKIWEKGEKGKQKTSGIRKTRVPGGKGDEAKSFRKTTVKEKKQKEEKRT